MLLVRWGGRGSFHFPTVYLQFLTRRQLLFRGRFVTAVGHGSGAIVDPQHLLTASHVIDWTVTNGKIGWLRFEPDFNNRDVFPPSMASITYSYEKISQPQGEYDVGSRLRPTGVINAHWVKFSKRSPSKSSCRS